MKMFASIKIEIFVLATIFLFAGIVTASADQSVGDGPEYDSVYSSNSQSLTQVVNEFGQISLSLDALGTVSTSGIVQVDKPNSATVRKAYLMAATTGFTNYQLGAGDVKIQGNDFVWEQELPNSIFSHNYWADVTAIVKPTIDNAPAGLVDIDITELNTYDIDGEILAIIFEDPSQTTDNTILLYFGAQNVNGDSFTIDFGTPIDKDDPNLILDYTLGISYGCQGNNYCGGGPSAQYSQIDVNGTRLTTSSGGQDDGELANGALITVGGIGDTNDNPTDPFALPINERSDDELYDLKPFVNDGDTSITINTLNPSDDDNILFAAVVLGATRSVITIDVEIALYNNPASDDQAPYENIINYMADGVYEASNGAHKLGTVTFYPSGANSNQADIIWVQGCHPNANVSGFGTDGLHVNMCDVFEDGSGPGVDYNFLSNDAHQKGGGYTLAHEWGHYYYSLYDEYVGSATNDHIFHFPHSTDIAVPNSIMNSQWNATGGNFNWLNFSVAKNDTQENAQHRVYLASGWETLVRPVSEDPRDGERSVLPVRLFHSELQEVAPGENEDSAIDLPGEARSALNIIWETPDDGNLLITESITSTFNVQLSSILGQNISYPDPILLLAFVHQDLTIVDMNVLGNIQLPDNSILSVAFTDDGIPPDAVAGDGLYSAILSYLENGIYSIQVTFDNNDNLAKFVPNAFSPSQDVNGNPIPLADPVLVDQSFVVSKTLQLSVSNVAPDDYGDTPADAYTIVPDNKSHSGKIDFAGDKDVFKFTTLDSGISYARVTGLALGMNPHLRILDADMSTVLFDEILDPVTSKYLFIPLKGVPTGTVVYAEVSNLTSEDSGGFYEFSIGKKLDSDTFLIHYIYMSLITR